MCDAFHWLQELEPAELSNCGAGACLAHKLGGGFPRVTRSLEMKKIDVHSIHSKSDVKFMPCEPLGRNTHG